MKKELLTRRSWTLILLSLLLSWSCLSVANAQSIGEKKVTMDLKGASVKAFFYVMEKQTGLNFICSADLVKSLPPVVVKVNKKPALEVLRHGHGFIKLQICDQRDSCYGHTV
jgi:type II secretory pathway component GspD/PulD (secretin)